MKSILFIILCGIAFFAKAQSIDKLIAQTEEYLTVYSNFPVYGFGETSFGSDFYPMKDFSFTKKELEELQEYADISNDSIVGWSVISIYQGRILANIDKIVHHKDFPKKGSNLFLASPDNKLFNFKLFKNTGGSHKSYFSVIYYKENDKVTYEEFSSIENYSEGKDVFDTDGYSQIDTIQTATGVKYLLRGNSITCTSCYWQYIRLVKFDNGKPVCEFSYELDTRWGWIRSIVDYNPETKTLTIEYETNDLTADCYCVEGIDGHSYSRFSNNDDEYIPKNCGCVFIFNGETFELDEYYWKRKKKNNDRVCT